jgi:hypothetical protein
MSRLLSQLCDTIDGIFITLQSLSGRSTVKKRAALSAMYIFGICAATNHFRDNSSHRQNRRLYVRGPIKGAGQPANHVQQSALYPFKPQNVEFPMINFEVRSLFLRFYIQHSTFRGSCHLIGSRATAKDKLREGFDRL